MLGIKGRKFRSHPSLTLEELVPVHHFVRKLEARLDLEFVRDLVRECYSTQGRPAIDPVVYFKLQLLMFFDGIRSERQLMEQVNVNLAYRWYIGYDLDEAVPDHSALSRIRERYGVSVFQKFFERIVELCMAAGLVWGKELYFDGTRIEANADIDRLTPRFHWAIQQHLSSVFVVPETSDDVPEHARRLIDKYDGTRIISPNTNAKYQRQADTHVCPTDPDATPLYSQPGHSRLGYNLHYVVDGGKSRIILAALVTPAAIQDQAPMLDLQRWARFRWQIHPDIAVADKKYGTLENIIGLETDGLRAYLGLPDHRHRKKLFSDEHFQYDADADHYICPAGERLPHSSYDRQRDVHMYRTSRRICQACPLKAQCTTSSYARIVTRSSHQAYLDRVRIYQTTKAFKKAQRKRSVWVEPMFGEAKMWHNLRRFRLRGLMKVNIQGLLTAAGQNIKRLLAEKTCSHQPDPPRGPALRAFCGISFMLMATTITRFSCESLPLADFFNRLV